MANNSINNKIGHLSNTESLDIERAGAGNMIRMFDQTDIFGYYNNSGSPESVISANIGSLCVDTTNGDVYIKKTDTVNTGWEKLISGAAGGIANLSPDSGADVTGTTVNIRGETGIVNTPSGIGTHFDAAGVMYLENRRFSSALIVDPSSTIGERGEYTTITAAEAAASSGDTIYIRPGTYTENITTSKDIWFIGLTGPYTSDKVLIDGTLNFSAGISGCKNLSFIGNPDGVISGGSATLDIVDCNFNVPSAAIRIQGTGSAVIRRCVIFGGDVSILHSSAVTVDVEYCTINQFSQTSSGTTNFRHCYFTAQANVFSPGTVVVDHCDIDSGSSVAFNNNNELRLRNSSITSNNVGGDFIIGTGDFVYTNIVVSGSATGIVGTQTITNYDWKPYGDTSGIVGVNSYNSSDFSVSTSGEVSLSQKAAFHAFLPSSDIGGSGAGALYTVGGTTPLTERFDIGNDFTPAGVFTAPVTGAYMFSIRAKIGSITVGNDDIILSVVTTSNTYDVGGEFNVSGVDTPSNQMAIQGSVLAQMTSGDTATFTITILGGPVGSVDIIGNAGGTGTFIYGNLLQ